MGEDAFPGNGSPKLNKDYEIEKLPKQAFLSQERA
jgi:hypothetical protein